MTSEPDKPAKSTPSGVSPLIEGANHQDHWIRALAVAIIETLRPLGEPRVAQFFDLLQRERELASGEPVAVPELSGEVTTRDTAQPPVLMSLVHSVERLRALFSVLLERAFTGGLTAPWREDRMTELLQDMEGQATALTRTANRGGSL